MIPIAAAVFGVGLIGFGLSHILWLSMLMMLVAGFGMMQGMTASNTIIQTLGPEDMRGRVMSYYTMAFVGMAPFGSLLAGALAHAIGAPRTVIVSGVACIPGSLWFWSRLKPFAKKCGRSTSDWASCSLKSPLSSKKKPAPASSRSSFCVSFGSGSVCYALYP